MFNLPPFTLLLIAVCALLPLLLLARAGAASSSDESQSVRSAANKGAMMPKRISLGAVGPSTSFIGMVHDRKTVSAEEARSWIMGKGAEHPS
jgi:hypothetical protein